MSEDFLVSIKLWSRSGWALLAPHRCNVNPSNAHCRLRTSKCFPYFVGSSMWSLPLFFSITSIALDIRTSLFGLCCLFFASKNLTKSVNAGTSPLASQDGHRGRMAEMRCTTSWAWLARSEPVSLGQGNARVVLEHLEEYSLVSANGTIKDLHASLGRCAGFVLAPSSRSLCPLGGCDWP